MKSDRQLQTDVQEELNWEPAVEATAIGVEVQDGIVTLAGHVDSYAQKILAEKAAQRVAGVKGVVMEIDVSLKGSSKRQDADLARSAHYALEWSASIPKDAIKLSVENGWVTLTGEVDWAYQRWAAVSAVRDLIGVIGVNDQIRIKPHVQPDDVKTKIEAALQRHAHKESKGISVSVSDGKVTLSGAVDSWAEKDAAHQAAWAAPGVNLVIDNLRVAV